MSQYSTGTIAINSATPTTVTGTGTLWNASDTPVTPFTTFQLTGLPQSYQVESINYTTQVMTLVSPGYVGATITGQSYTIQKDFTSLGIPEVSPNDVDFANTITRAMRKIDYLVSLASSYGYIPKGNWNASTDTPTLPTAAVGNLGWDYSVSVGGTYGGVVYAPGDSITSDGTTWYKRVTATADISAVADISEEVVIVANNIADVSTVAANDTNISAVAAIDAEVTSVAGNSTNINAVAADLANISTVATDIANVDTVAGIAANISTVAAVDSEVSTVAGIAANVTITAGISADVTTAAGVAANITTVAGVSTEVATVAGVATDVTTVAGISGDISTVAAVGDSIPLVAAIDDSIPIVAAIDSEIVIVAGDTVPINIVAGDHDEILVVAGDTVAINSAYTNIAAILAAPDEAASAAASAAKLTGTSTTTITPALSELVFTTQAGKDFNAGSYVHIISNSVPTVYLYGSVTSYVGTTLTLTPEKIGTATEKADWTILGRVGARGIQGIPGPAGSIDETEQTGILKGDGANITAATAGVDYAAPLTADQNYVSDAEKTVLGNTSGVNTGDQDLSGKQDALVSGTNIKTINGASVLGSGNVAITSGGMSMGYSARTSNTILGAGDLGKLIDATTGGFTQTITAAATLGAGWYCFYRNSSAANVTVDPNSSETIDGVATGIIYPGWTVLLSSDGTNTQGVKIEGHTVEVLTSGTSWVAKAFVRSAYLRMVAGGGSGGASNSSTRPVGGGGGAYAEKNIRVVPGMSYTYAIGAGGTGQTYRPANGNAGGNTTWATPEITCKGGIAGFINPISVTIAPASATGGDINISGQYSTWASASGDFPSFGGDSPFGIGGYGVGIASQAAPTGYGSGSCGATNGEDVTDGRPGCIVLEY